jgi:uncharacterized membrane protein YgcG
VDNTKNHVLDRATVQAEIANLQAHYDVDVYVRGFEDSTVLPGGSLDGYAADQVSQCTNWRSPEGKAKGNLILVLFSMDHKSTLFAGVNFAQTLNQDTLGKIRVNKLNSQFREGDFTAGVTDALNAMGDRIGGKTDDSNGTSIHPNWRLIGTITGGIVAGLMLIVLLIVAYVRTQSWLRANTARKTKRQEAIDKKSDVALAYLDLSEQMESLGVTVPTALQIVAGKDADAIDDLCIKVKAAFEGFDAAWSSAISSSENDPTLRRDLQGYDKNLTFWTELAAQHAALLEDVNKLQALCDGIEAKKQEATKKLGDQRERCASLRQSNDLLEPQGFHRLDTEFQATAPGRLDAIQELINAKRYAEALELLDTFNTERKKLQDATTNLPAHRNELLTRAAETRTEWSAASDMLQNAEAAVKTLERTSSTSCWQPASSQIDAANAKHAACESKIDEAEAALTMESQQWDEAVRLLDGVDAAVKDVQSECQSAQTHVKRIKQIAENASANLDTIEDTLSQAISQVREFEGNQSGYVVTLETIRDDDIPALDALREGGRPDFEAFATELKRVTDRMRDTIKEASDEHNRSVRKHQRSYTTYSAPTFTYDSNGFLIGVLVGSELANHHTYTPPPVYTPPTTYSSPTSTGTFGGDWGGGGNSSSGSW